MIKLTKLILNKSNPLTKSYTAQRLLATCAITLPLLMVLDSTQASTLRDIERNDSQANQSAALYVGNLGTSIKGTVSGSDRRDFYHFTDQGTPLGEFNAIWQPQGGKSTLEIWKDVNKNRKLEPKGDRLVSRSSNKGQEILTIRSAPNQQFLALVRTGGSQVDNYVLQISVPVRLKLNVYKARSFGKFDDNGPADFYVTTRFSATQSKSKVIPNDDTPSFNHSHVAHANYTNVPFEIDIIDSDSKGRFSFKNQDDRADINPSPKAKILKLSYNLVSHQVRLLDGTLVGKSGSPSRTIKLKGDKKGDQVEVEFAIF